VRTPQRAGHSRGYAHLEQKLDEQKLQIHKVYSSWLLALGSWLLTVSLAISL
jgi:hypothetical protein